MTEIRISVELGMSERLQQFVSQLFGNVHKAVMPEVHTAQAVAAPAPKAEKPEKVKEEKPVTDMAAPAEQKKDEPAQSAVTLPDLRKAISKVWNGGKNQSVTDAILKNCGASKLTELPEDRYAEVYEALTAKAKELGL